MQSLYCGSFILVYSIFTVHLASAAITKLSSDEVAQTLPNNQSITNELKLTRSFIDSILIKPDENDQYVDDTVRIFKRDANDHNYQAVLKSAIHVMSTKKPVVTIRTKPKNSGDLLFDVIRHMIEEEKVRRHFDLEHPSNSKFTKQNQMIWDKIRIKAAGELLIHPKRRYQAASERIFDNFKEEIEEITRGPVRDELFVPLKERNEKQFYLDKYNKLFGSTLKPSEN